MDTWILVADASRARVFAASKRGTPWKLVEERDHPESRMKNSDIKLTEPGRVRQSFGAGHRPAMEPDTEPKEVEAEHFAHELAERVSDGLKHNAFSGLVLVAPPHFLGLLKNSLDAQVKKRLVATVDKDYTDSDARELVARLDAEVYPDD